MITIKTTAKMGHTIHTLFANLPQQSSKFQNYPFLSMPITPHLPKPPAHLRALRISCTKDKDDEILAMELGLEIKKLNTNMVERAEAFNKSRELLFSEICSFMGLTSDDLRKKWKKMDEEEKWVLTKMFVAEWSDHFHPLSAKSVKEMVEEFIGQEGNKESSKSNDDVSMFSDLRNFLGFSRNSEG